MSIEITLEPMTAEMYHTFFQEYENDSDLYLDKSEYFEYIFEKLKVDAYIQRQIDLNRQPFAIMYGDEIVGELKIYDIVIVSMAANHIVPNRGFYDFMVGLRKRRNQIESEKFAQA